MKTHSPGSPRRFLNLLYLKLFRINDSPHRVAAGVGIGFFCGIMPGTGPIAALFLALVLRVNRAAALLGSLATNTWLSIVTFLLSIKLGSAIMGLDWQVVRSDWQLFLNEFRWLNLFKLPILRIILPVIIGYALIGVFLGLVTYVGTLIILTKLKYADKGRTDISG